MAVSLTASPFNFCTASAHRIQGEQRPLLFLVLPVVLGGFIWFFPLRFHGWFHGYATSAWIFKGIWLIRAKSLSKALLGAERLRRD